LYKLLFNFFLIILIITTTLSCKPSIIPKSSLFNTKKNREIISFFNTYKQKLESMNYKKILLLVSKNYNDINNDFDKIKKKIIRNYNFISDININFYIYDIQKINKKYFLVIYLFKIKLLINLSSDKKWSERKDIGYLILQNNFNKNYKIIGGF